MSDLVTEDTVPQALSRALWAVRLRGADPSNDENGVIETALVDTVTDLMHLTKAIGADWDDILDHARMHFTAEDTGVEPE